MGIFDELFGSISKGGKKKVTEIQDLFQIDLKKLPIDTFDINQSESLELGDGKTKYFKHLTYKECGLFDQIDVIMFDSGSANITFFSNDPDQINMNSMKELVNNIYQIYGLDSHQRGKFTNEDTSTYHDSMRYSTFGRSWRDYKKYKYPVTISRDDEMIEMTIWGVNR